MKKCKCYHLQPTTRYTYNPITGAPIPHDVEIGVCWGTKECDQCNCGGDEIKCDFYPNVRKKVQKEVSKRSNLMKWNVLYHNYNSHTIEEYNIFKHSSFAKDVDKLLKENLSKQEFADRLDVECERKKEVKDNSNFWPE